LAEPGDDHIPVSLIIGLILLSLLLLVSLWVVGSPRIDAFFVGLGVGHESLIIDIAIPLRPPWVTGDGVTG
jgi:hypothetical protein